MPDTSTGFGTCPLCEATIGAVHVIITYETPDGVDMWAECPACGEIVTPKT